MKLIHNLKQDSLYLEKQIPCTGEYYLPYFNPFGVGAPYGFH